MRKYIIALLWCFLYVSVYSQVQTYSRLGYNLPTQGTIRFLVVFAESKNDTTSIETSTWKAGQLPTDADTYFDANFSQKVNRTVINVSSI